MLEQIKNLPDIAWFLIIAYLFLVSLMLFILPFIVTSINSKIKKALHAMLMIQDEMIELQNSIETLRKETTVSKLLAQDEQQGMQ